MFENEDRVNPKMIMSMQSDVIDEARESSSSPSKMKSS